MAAALLVAGAAAAAAVLRAPLRRWLTVRRLERAESEVAEAVEGGRLARATGEALLQHLEGLRRSIAGGRREG
jgi:hypothetical protein